jgi:hypothetical protein
MQKQVLIFLVTLPVCFQMTVGTFTFVYIGKVGNGKQISYANGVYWTMLLVCQTVLLVNEQALYLNFCVFTCITAIAVIFVAVLVKPTEGLSQEMV